MSHFAKVENGIVIQVIVAEQNFINTGAVGDPATWIQTSYNTHGGSHPQDKPLRKNYAGVGYTYDLERDAFIPPKPFLQVRFIKPVLILVRPQPLAKVKFCLRFIFTILTLKYTTKS
jgi:hypothetical protein